MPRHQHKGINIISQGNISPSYTINTVILANSLQFNIAEALNKDCKTVAMTMFNDLNNRNKRLNDICENKQIVG